MNVNADILAILRCPCDSTVLLEAKEQGFECTQCKVLFPLRDQIPCFLIDEALLPTGTKGPWALPWAPLKYGDFGHFRLP